MTLSCANTVHPSKKNYEKSSFALENLDLPSMAAKKYCSFFGFSEVETIAVGFCFCSELNFSFLVEGFIGKGVTETGSHHCLGFWFPLQEFYQELESFSTLRKTYFTLRIFEQICF